VSCWYWNGGDKRTYTIREAHNIYIRAGQTATLTFRRSQRKGVKRNEEKNLLERFERRFVGAFMRIIIIYHIDRDTGRKKTRERERENNESRLYGTTRRRYTINNIIHHAWYFLCFFYILYFLCLYIFFSYIARCVYLLAEDVTAAADYYIIFFLSLFIRSSL